jgi:hypothetical protein
MTEPTILDMCCGSRMFWFDKQDARAVFVISGLNSTPCVTVAAWLSILT